MSEDLFCKKCSQRQNCREVYQKLGEAKGPSVAAKAVIAFVLPIIAFISALVIFDKFLIPVINADKLRTAVSFIIAVSATLTLIVVTKMVNNTIARG